VDLWFSSDGFCFGMPEGKPLCISSENQSLHTPTSKAELSVPYPFSCQQERGTLSACQVKDGPMVTLTKGSGVFRWMPCSGDTDGSVRCLNLDGTLLDVRTLLPAGTGAVYELHCDLFAETPTGRLRIQFDQDEGYSVDTYQSPSFDEVDYAFAKSGGTDAGQMNLDATFSLSTGRPTGQGCGVVDKTLYCWAGNNSGQAGPWGAPNRWSALYATPGATPNKSLQLVPGQP